MASVVSDSVRPLGRSSPGSSVHGLLQTRTLEWVVMLFSRGDLPDLRIEPMSPASPALQAGSLLLSHRGSPGVEEFQTKRVTGTKMQSHGDSAFVKGDGTWVGKHCELRQEEDLRKE